MPRFRLKTLLILLTVACVLLGAWGWINARMDAADKAWRASHTAFVPRQKDWPSPLKNLLGDGVVVPPFDISEVQVYCLYFDWNEEYVWKMPADAQTMKWLASRWSLRKIQSPPTWPIVQQRRGIYGIEIPAWWSPRLDDDTVYYDVPGGSDEWEVAWHPTEEIVYVHCLFRW
ncbi:MAG: hypothetical protein KDA44_03830 [Planctomycetales bacterium]|nr:hypothetical protein [Planctomycetales bacterium]